MRKSLNLERVRAVREAEERQSRALMESLRLELARLENALENSRKRHKGARGLMAMSLDSGEALDRFAATEEMAIAERFANALLTKIEEIERQAKKATQFFLSKRIERRQVETLLEAAKARDALETKRKEQTSMDEWHRGQHGTNSGRNIQASFGDSDNFLTRR